jgi:FSR family fosmidomycin resistance protein-like MFS transporter
MTQAALPASGVSSYTRVLGAISAAHFVSHYVQLLLGPLLPFVRAEFGVSYTEIGFALAAFNLVSAVLQTPAGFLVDRLGARTLLVGGLALGGAAFIAAGLTSSFWLFVGLFAVAGVANTVYHPADYAMLSQHIPAARIGQAFSVHTFAGMLGGAVAPPVMLALYQTIGWRGAFVVSGAVGFAVAAYVTTVPDTKHARASAEPGEQNPDWRVLTSLPVLLNLVFFALLSLTTMGIYNYTVVALDALYGTALTAANTALTGYLMLSALGVLAGGWLVGRTGRHALVATLGLLATAAFVFAVVEVNLDSFGLFLMLSAAGFSSGIIMPSRDMIVRSVTPEGSFGKVFGFVTTGFNISGGVAPLLFGAMMDHSSPRLVFVSIAALTLLAIATVTQTVRRG